MILVFPTSIRGLFSHKETVETNKQYRFHEILITLGPTQLNPKFASIEGNC